MIIKRVIITLLLMALYTLILQLYVVQMYDPSFFTGWSLVITTGLILALLTARHFYPSTNPTIQQFYYSTHMVAGWFMLYLFFLHIEFTYPKGMLEVMITILFLILCATGIFGRILQYYNQMKHHREVNLPTLRRQLSEEARQLVVDSAIIKGEKSLAEFYDQKLRVFFDTIPPLFSTALNHKHETKMLLQEIHDEIKRNSDDKQQLDLLRKLVNKKSTTEYQAAINQLLSGWSFIHKILTYAFGMLIVLHVILVYVFTG